MRRWQQKSYLIVTDHDQKCLLGLLEKTHLNNEWQTLKCDWRTLKLKAYKCNYFQVCIRLSSLYMWLHKKAQWTAFLFQTLNAKLTTRIFLFWNTVMSFPLGNGSCVSFSSARSTQAIPCTLYGYSNSDLQGYLQVSD